MVYTLQSTGKININAGKKNPNAGKSNTKLTKSSLSLVSSAVRSSKLSRLMMDSELFFLLADRVAGMWTGLESGVFSPFSLLTIFAFRSAKENLVPDLGTM
jgi:hypothetical protein